jgi:hypothetical protein
MEAECPFEAFISARPQNYTPSQPRKLQPWRWRQNVSLKRRYPPIELQDVTTQNASNLKMEAECPFERTVSTQKTTRYQPRTLLPWKRRQNVPLKRLCPQNYTMSTQRAVTLKMEAECPFERTVSTQKTTRYNSPELFNPEDGGRMSLWSFYIRPPTKLHGINPESCNPEDGGRMCPQNHAVGPQLSDHSRVLFAY